MFNLIVECLSLLIQKATSDGLWEGVETSKGGIKITHLQFADDTVIFCPPETDYLLNIKKTLILFQLASGLQVNFHKSSLFGIHIDESWLQSAAKNLLCKVGYLPFTYLGLPIGGNMKRIEAWDPIIKRIERKLATWKGKSLSIAGRLTLIKAAISSLPIYFMSLFPAPRGVIEKINALQRRFLWCGDQKSRALSLVSWDIMELPKILGGVGCGNILHRNLALMFKWVWRYINEPTALWRKVIELKYGYRLSFQAHDLITPSSGGPWRSMCSHLLKNPLASAALKTFIRRKVGNGLKTFFWLDKWAGPRPFNLIFPRLYSIATNKQAKVRDYGYWDGSRWIWNFSWARSFRPRDEEEWGNLLSHLNNVYLSLDNEDSHVWHPHPSGSFSVKSLTLEFAKSAAPTPCPSIRPMRIWAGLIPPRIELFLWLALLGKINSREKLLKLKIIEVHEAECPLCLNHIESSDHLLLLCPFSWEIWNWWLSIWDLNWVFPSNLREAFLQWHSHIRSPFFKKIWLAIFPIIIWSIWKERNSRIFNGVACSRIQIQELILVRICWWMKGWGIRFPYNTDDVLRNPSCLNWSQTTVARMVPPLNSVSVWSAPPIGWFKWNVDASVSPSLYMSAVGGVLRVNHGHFKIIFSSPVPLIEINSAEIIAIFRATQISMRLDYLRTSQYFVILHASIGPKLQ